MKNIISKSIVLFCTILFFSACSNELDNVIDNNEKEIEVVEQGTMLKFKDQTVFDATVAKLKNMNDSDLTAWSDSVEFYSLQTVFVEAMKEVANSDLSYSTLKDKYSNVLYFPEYKEDYGIYIPVSKKEYSAFLNKEGNVMIGDEIKNFVDITNYESLQKTGQALYKLPKSELRSSNYVNYNNIPFQIMYRNEGGLIGNNFVSEYLKGDYKIRLEVSRVLDSSSGNEVLLFNVDARKKNAGGWSNYYAKLTLNGGLYLWMENGMSRSSFALPEMVGYGTLVHFIQSDRKPLIFSEHIWFADQVHRRCYSATSKSLVLRGDGFGEIRQNNETTSSFVDLAVEKQIIPGNFKFVLDNAYFVRK